MTLSERFLIPQTIIFTKRFDGGDGGGGVKKDGDNFCTFSGKKGFKESSFFQQSHLAASESFPR